MTNETLEAPAPAPGAPEPRCYRIRRYSRRGGRPRTLHANVTLTVARLHCSDPRTKGSTWFDGFDFMPGCSPKS